jgi:phosphatidylinositol alpha-mannosyltransferase
VRIALVSPYSWTYPGGVTRHIEALACELIACGHEPWILAPFDPDDSLSRRLHRGARPQPRAKPEHFVSLGRTVGIAANGAVSNVSLTPFAVQTLRAELRHGVYDVAHIHEPVVPVVGWDALLSAGRLPLVGTFHTYSENLITNGTAAVLLGGRRRMNRLHVRIAVSEAAAWTARRFYGGRYRIVPNGVHLLDGDVASGSRAEPGIDATAGEPQPLRLLFIGQAVERKGLPVLLRAFEALREHVPATLTLVGAGRDEVAHLMLDDRGVAALGKVSEERKLQELARAEVLCAPSLHGESFGMVLTEAFAAATPVVASDIPGYRDVVRHGSDGLLVAPGDALGLAESLRLLALDQPLRERMAEAARERAERFAWPSIAAEVLDCYDAARLIGSPATRIGRAAVRHGFAPSDLLPRVPAERLASLEAQTGAEAVAQGGRRRRTLRRLGLAASTLSGGLLAGLALQRVGIANVAASLVASKPGLLAAGLGLMCAAVFARAIAWHAILSSASTWRRARRRDAMQGTFIGVLMSATLPARMGEPARALVLARRLGRARETLPLVWGTIASQTLLNLLALAVLGGVTISTVHFDGHAARTLLLVALIPVAAVLLTLLGPVVLGPAAASPAERMRSALAAIRPSLARLRDGLHAFRSVRPASAATLLQLVAWALQWVSCWLLLVALGLDAQAGAGAAAAVLFAVNVTAAVPVTPANVGVFQAACAVVLIGAYHVSAPEAIAYGIVLQAVELASALIMGLPALVNEGLSWREVRLRTVHAAPPPVTLAPLPDGRLSGAAERLARIGG